MSLSWEVKRYERCDGGKIQIIFFDNFFFENLKKKQTFSKKIQALKTHPNLAKDESKFAAEVIKRKVSEQELTKEYQKQKKKWEKMGRPVCFI